MVVGCFVSAQAIFWLGTIRRVLNEAFYLCEAHLYVQGHKLGSGGPILVYWWGFHPSPHFEWGQFSIKFSSPKEFLSAEYCGGGCPPPSRLSHIFLSTAAHCLGHLSKLWPRPRQAYRYSYDYPSRKWDRSVVVVSIESTHFSEGNLRRCFRMKDLTKPDGENDFVAKASKDKNDDIEVPGHPATQSLFGHLVNFTASGSGRRGKGRYFSWHPSVHSSPIFFAKHQDGLATGLLIKEGCNWGGGRQMQIICL